MQKNEKNSLEIHTYVLEAVSGCFTVLNGGSIILIWNNVILIIARSGLLRRGDTNLSDVKDV